MQLIDIAASKKQAIRFSETYVRVRILTDNYTIRGGERYMPKIEGEVRRPEEITSNYHRDGQRRGKALATAVVVGGLAAGVGSTYSAFRDGSIADQKYSEAQTGPIRLRQT